MSAPSRPWQVHGMGHDLVLADWPPLTTPEVAAVLASFPDAAGRVDRIVWRSPRPFSAAAVVALSPPDRAPCGEAVEAVFVKRHHPDVRRPEDLAPEHAFADHLARRGIPVPAVLRTSAGPGGHRHDGWTYEVSRVGLGLDLYRDVPSWMPYREVPHASVAGSALARLHLAAADFSEPARPPGILRSGDALAGAPDPVVALGDLVARRPALAGALAGRDWAGELGAALGPSAAGPGAILCPSGRPVDQWGHGDWHPSNLLWEKSGSAPRVASVLDLGLAGRTSALFDLAVALERATVAWLDLGGASRPAVDLAAGLALLAGYQAVRPLAGAERAALLAVLPRVHLDFAVSEMEYFAQVLDRPDLAELAWTGYALGHLIWWRSSDGRGYLDALREGLLTAP